MQIHEIIYYPALEVVPDLIDDHLAANINQLHIGKIPLILIDRLVDLLIVPYPVSKILGCHLWILALVVWRCSFDLDNIRHNQLLIVTLRLDV